MVFRKRTHLLLVTAVECRDECLRDAPSRVVRKRNGLSVVCILLSSNGDGIPDDCEVAREGDANGDGSVNPLDAGFVMARFGCPVGTGDPSCDAADVNGDGEVNPLDSGFVMARFGTCP